MATYPTDAYAPVMDYYKKLSDNLKPEANKILGYFSKRYKEGEAPPQEMLSSLKALVNKKEVGLEAKTNAAHASSDAKTESITGLLGIITAIGAATAGYPVIAMAAAAVTLTSLY